MLGISRRRTSRRILLGSISIRAIEQSVRNWLIGPSVSFATYQSKAFLEPIGVGEHHSGSVPGHESVRLARAAARSSAIVWKRQR